MGISGLHVVYFFRKYETWPDTLNFRHNPIRIYHHPAIHQKPTISIEISLLTEIVIRAGLMCRIQRAPLPAWKFCDGVRDFHA